jgi:hypothetical protein
MLDEQEAHEAIVEPRERRAGAAHHIDFDALARQAVEQRAQHRRRVGALQERRVHEVDAEDADRLLLRRRRRVEQVDVRQDLRRRRARLRLELDADPAAAVLADAVTPRRDRVGEREERRRRRARRTEPLDELVVLARQHRLEPLPADVALGRPVNRVAHGHVVGRQALRDGARGAADAEEPARDLLAGADLGERAVARRVHVHTQRLLVRAVLLVHACPRPR